MSSCLLPEWAAQRLIQLCWPSQVEYWGQGLADAQKTHCQIIAAVSQTQPALLLHSPSSDIDDIRQQLSNANARLENVSLVAQANNDIWCRDYGPISLSDGQLLDFQFTGWGGKFPAQLDNAATQNLVNAGIYPPVKSFELILEGGAIDYDGNGSLITTTTCLLNPNRNTGMSKDEYEEFFATHMGIEQVLWLDHGWLAGDDTDSHVDMLARFAPDNQLLFQGCDDSEDEHYAALQALKAELAGLRNINGDAYHLIELPLPAARYDAEGDRLPASYANFLVTNQQVLVPSYDCEQDAEALALIAACFPGRQALGINCEALIQQYGSLHCATMQVAE